MMESPANPGRFRLSIEAAELNELFLWKKPEDADPARVREELADVLIYSLLLLEKYGLDLEEIVQKKLAINDSKYPADKARNSAAKYTDL
jgi:NTP pyrophosphatase (non-canonical NTP hydrolase)